MKLAKKISRYINKYDRLRRPLILVATFALFGYLIIVASKAATTATSLEAENGIGSPYSLSIAKTDASNGNAIKFRSNASTIIWRNPTPVSTYTTQPGVPSNQLDFSKVLIGENPDFQWFGSNALNPPTGNNGQMRTHCVPSHISKDDAIVYPGQPGAAHEHIFYGNTDSNAFSTSSSIVNNGGSTCAGNEANRTSYWFPTMLDANGQTRIPNEMILYYKNQGIPMPTATTEGYASIPQGIKMLAGNSKSTYDVNNPTNVSNLKSHSDDDGFACGEAFTNSQSDLIPSNPAISVGGRTVRTPACTGGRLNQKVLFPRCWDGKAIDFNAPAKYPEDSQHTVYPSNGHEGGNCPAGFTKVFPGISVLFQWNLAPGETTQGWTLSSDHNHVTGVTQPGGTTRHGDYIAGWNTEIVDSWTKKCLNTEWNCQSHFVSNTAGDFSAKSNFPATRYPYLKPVNFELFQVNKPIFKNTVL